MDGALDLLKAAAFVFGIAVMAYGFVSLARHLDKERAARRRREANRTHVLVPFRPTTVRCLYAHDVNPKDATYSRDHGWICRACAAAESERVGNEWSTGDVA